MNLDNTVLVTHRNCMDGSVCAILFLARGGKKENIYFSSPSHEDIDDLVGHLAETHHGPILIADASISLKLATKLDNQNIDITILDHHKSAIPLNKFDWCLINEKNTKAGGRLLYDYFKSKGMFLSSYEELVMAADDYDRWIREHPKSEDLVTLHQAIEQESFVERFRKNPSLKFIDNEKYLIQIFKGKRDRYVERKKNEVSYIAKRIQGHDVIIGLVEAGKEQSILGNAICSDTERHCDIAVLVNSGGVSFRGRAGCPVDLSKIAKSNFGGGHYAASGCSTSLILGENFGEFVFNKIKWS